MKEATLLLQGINHALGKGIRHLILEGDNLLVTKLVQGKWKNLWQLDHFIKDIHSLLHHFDYQEINHIVREENQVADFVAFVGHLVSSFMIITSQRYSQLNEILFHDASRMIYSRKRPWLSFLIFSILPVPKNKNVEIISFLLSHLISQEYTKPQGKLEIDNI